MTYDPDADKPEKPKREPQRYKVLVPVNARQCGYCEGFLVWTETATGSRMPLSWATREPLVEGGKIVAFTMIPHFVDCPGWPRKTKKAKS